MNMSKNAYVKEVKRSVKSDGKVIGWNIVRVYYDPQDNKVGEKVIMYIPK